MSRKSEHHALLHRFQAADVEIGVWVGDERRKIGGPLAHQILHVAPGLAGHAAEGEIDVDEVLGQIPERPEIRQFLPGAGAEEQHQLAALELARLAQAPSPFGHRAHRRASGAGADHHDRAFRMVGHEEAHPERPGHLDRVADLQVAEIVADHSAHRAALVILQHPLHGERDVVVAGPLAVAGAGDRILARVMRPALGVDARRNDADRLAFEHRKRHGAEIEHDVMGVVVLADFGHPDIADDGRRDRARRRFRPIEIGVRAGGRPGRDDGGVGADLERRFFVSRARRGLWREATASAASPAAPASPSSSALSSAGRASQPNCASVL